MTAKDARRTERILMLRAIILYGGDSGLYALSVANAVGLERRGIGQKLRSMELDGLVVGEIQPKPQRGKRPPTVWTVTEQGRALAFETTETQPEPQETTDEP